MKNRSINIELLRIFSMLMIVYHHFYVHSHFEGLVPLSKKAIVLQGIGNFGKIGVLIFGLITGYYIANQTFKLNRLFRLSNLIRFYTLLAFISWWLIEKPSDMIKENLISALFPIIFQKYWFVTAYIMVLLFQPIIKHYLNNESRSNQLKIFIIIMMAFSGVEWIGVLFNTPGYFGPSEVLSFIMIVFAGHLIRLYEQELRGKYYRVVLVFLVVTFFLVLLKPILAYYTGGVFALPHYFLTGLASPNAILFSLSLFVVVLNLKLANFEWLTKISPLTFDVYLLHDNPFFRPLIWTVIFQNKIYMHEKWFPLVIVFEPLFVFMISLLVGKLRLQLFESWRKKRIRIKA